MSEIDSGEFLAAKTRLTRANAEKVELQVQVMKQELIKRETVTKAWNEKASQVRNKLLALPELAPMLYEKGSIAAIKKELKARVYEILEELAGESDENW